MSGGRPDLVISGPYRAEHYERWHSLLRAVPEQIPRRTASDSTARALPAAARADLVGHLAGAERVPREGPRSQPTDSGVLASGPPRERTA